MADFGTIDPSILAILNSANTFTADQKIRSANGTLLTFHRTVNSLGFGAGFTYNLNDSDSTESTYGLSYVGIEDNTAGAVRGDFYIQLAIAGTNGIRFRIGTSGNGGIIFGNNQRVILLEDGQTSQHSFSLPDVSGKLLSETGGLKISSVSKTANYTLTALDGRIIADASGGAFTLTLPTAASNEGKIYEMKKTDTSYNIVTIATTSSQTIDGLTTWELRNPFDELMVMSDGSNWRALVTANYDYNGYRRTGGTAPSRYYIAGAESQTAMSGTATVTANTLYAQPFMVSRTSTIDSAGVNVSTGVASSSVRMGVYKTLNGVPGGLVGDFGTVATTTPAAFKEITGLSQKLQPGMYWLAAVFSHGPGLRTMSQSTISFIYGVDNAATTTFGTGYTGSHTFGTLPSTFPTITVSTATAQPAFFYHFSA